MVRFPAEDVRATSMGDGRTQFADGYPLLVASERSLDELNSWLDQPVPIERFRPNIVLAGLPEPFIEDEIDELQIGALRISMVKPCDRCAVTTIDQDTAAKGREPLLELGARRVRPAFGGGRGIMFAMNAVPRTPGEIRVGDSVAITMHQDSYEHRVEKWNEQ